MRDVLGDDAGGDCWGESMKTIGCSRVALVPRGSGLRRNVFGPRPPVKGPYFFIQLSIFRLTNRPPETRWEAFEPANNGAPCTSFRPPS